MPTGFSELVAAIKGLCFPPVCLACRAELPAMRDFLFCAACALQIEPVRAPLCPCCGVNFPNAAAGNHFCAACLTTPPEFSQARALVHYLDPIRPAIHALKYGGKTTALPSFSRLFREYAPAQGLVAADLILPVPLHAGRLRERGFNQALLLAQSFFPEHRRRIAPDLLLRTRATTPQTGLTGADRRRNVRGAFAVRTSGLIKGKTVLLVDDVFTTGTTVNECARTLKKAGCHEVRVLTLARVKELL